jgi:hypothetical protein
MYKKVLSIFLSLFLLMFLLNSIPVKADNINVTINGQNITFDQQPIMKNNTVLVPMRAFFEALGANVHWDASTQTVTATRGNVTIQLTIGSKIAKVNGQDKQLSVDAELINGYTYIPLRFVGESLGDQVTWQDGNIIIKSNFTSYDNNELKGNTEGNIILGMFGKIAGDGEWLYISNEFDHSHNIYKMHNDGTDFTKVCNDYAIDLNVVNGWIYYINGDDNFSIYKIQTDGNNRTKLNNTHSDNLLVVNNWIYYRNSDDENIYKMYIDGSQCSKLSNDRVGNFDVSNGWIYYFNLDKYNEIYKMRTDGSQKTNFVYNEVIYGSNISTTLKGYNLIVSNGWLYFMDEFTQNLCKIRTDGTDYKDLGYNYYVKNTRKSYIDFGFKEYNIYKNYIYGLASYTESSNPSGGSSSLFKMDINGNNITKINCDTGNVFVSNGYIFIYKTDIEHMDIALYRLDANDNEILIKESKSQ